MCPSSLSTLLSETGSLAEPVAYQFREADGPASPKSLSVQTGWWASKPQESPCSGSDRITGAHPCAWLPHGCCRGSSGPHAHMANKSPTDLSSQPWTDTSSKGTRSQPGMAIHTCNPSTCGIRERRASSSRPVWLRSLVANKQKGINLSCPHSLDLI